MVSILGDYAYRVREGQSHRNERFALVRLKVNASVQLAGTAAPDPASVAGVIFLDRVLQIL